MMGFVKPLNVSKIDVVIVSDFNCYSCQKAEPILKEVYDKYNKEVSFRFIYFSDYIDKSILACEAAMRQNKFKLMHDIISENAKSLNNDSVYFEFANKIDLDIDEFAKDFKDNSIIKKVLETKNHLINNNIFSTPTFIVNKKLLINDMLLIFLKMLLKKN